MSKRGEEIEARAKPLRKVNANKHQQNVKKHFANQTSNKEIAAGIGSKENGSPLGFSKHYASTTEIIYSPFTAQVYNPPHLSSQQLTKNVFKAECSNWQVRRSSSRKYDYDQLYAANQRRYELLRPSSQKRSSSSNRKWSNTKSKIKYLLDEDRTTYCHFEKKSRNTKKSVGRAKHPDDDLSEESSGVN